MNLFVRLLKTLLLYVLRPRRIDVLGESRLTFLVWPNDLDTNLHMNNGRYLTLMDLGRLDLLLRVGAFMPALKRRWNPVLAGMQVRFRKPLNLFQRIEVRTRIVGWDEKWVFMEQKIFLKGELAAHAWIKGVFVGREGTIPITRVMEVTGVTKPSPPLPAEFLAWQEADRRMAAMAKG